MNRERLFLNTIITDLSVNYFVSNDIYNSVCLLVKKNPIFEIGRFVRILTA